MTFVCSMYRFGKRTSYKDDLTFRDLVKEIEKRKKEKALTHYAVYVWELNIGGRVWISTRVMIFWLGDNKILSDIDGYRLLDGVA